MKASRHNFRDVRTGQGFVSVSDYPTCIWCVGASAVEHAPRRRRRRAPPATPTSLSRTWRAPAAARRAAASSTPVAAMRAVKRRRHAAVLSRCPAARAAKWGGVPCHAREEGRGGCAAATAATATAAAHRRSAVGRRPHRPRAGDVMQCRRPRGVKADVRRCLVKFVRRGSLASEGRCHVAPLRTPAEGISCGPNRQGCQYMEALTHDWKGSRIRISWLVASRGNYKCLPQRWARIRA